MGRGEREDGKGINTFGSELMILIASDTCFCVAPPPTSKKLAGLPP